MMAVDASHSAAKPNRTRRWGRWIIIAIVVFAAFDAVGKFESRIADLENRLSWVTAELADVRQVAEEAKSTAEDAQNTAEEIQSALPASLQ